jgi:tetratricopeptide (TPR) repeat protein
MLDAVEALAENPLDRVSIVAELGSLLDKSLLREIDDPHSEPRFMMLELLREFGTEQLVASGEQEQIRRWHAKFFLSLAEQAESKLESAEQMEWVHRMEQEHDNLRSALQWSMTTIAASDICLRLATTLGLFWEVRGYFSEGRERLSAVLNTHSAQEETAARAQLLARAAELAYRQSDYPATISFAQESLEICRLIGDLRGVASALIKLGNAATEVGDYETASRYLEESLEIWRMLEDQHGTARVLISLGWAALRPGDYPLAKSRLEEALSISRELGDTRSIGFELSGLGEVALRQGDFARATQLLEESLELRRQLGNKWGVGVSLGTLGWVAICEGDWDRARERLHESLEVRHEIGDKGGSAWCLERLAEMSIAHGRPEKAVRLLAAAAALRISIGSVIDPADQSEYQNKLNTLRTDLGAPRFGRVWDEGHALTLEQAIAHAFEDQDAPSGDIGDA